MRRMTLITCAFVLMALAVPSACGQGSATKTGEQSADNSVRLVRQPALRKDVAAVPLIANPKDAAQRKINADLTKINEMMHSTLIKCDRDYLAWVRMMPHDKGVRLSMDGDWTRTVEVTMTGPRYLSYLIADGDFCGGAHPDMYESALVYDLRKGVVVDWTALLPEGVAKRNPEKQWNGELVPQVIDSALQDFYLLHLEDADCRKRLSDLVSKTATPQGAWFEMSFVIWPDAKQGKLVVTAGSLPHVIQACAEHVALTTEEATQLGFSEEILQSLNAAKAVLEERNQFKDSN